MKKFIYLLALFFSVAAVGAEAFFLPGKNFVNEGDFAQGGKNWHFFDTRAGKFLTTGGPDGGPCFKITNGAANYVYLYNKGSLRGWGIALEEGKTYTLSAWIKTENLDLSALHRQSVLFVTNYGWSNSVSLSPQGGTNDWKRYSITFQAPAQTRKVDKTANPYNMLLFWPPKAKGTLYLAKIQIEEGSQATDFTSFCNLQSRMAIFRQNELNNSLQNFANSVKNREQMKKLADNMRIELDNIGKMLQSGEQIKNMESILAHQEALSKKLASSSSRMYLRDALQITHQDDLPDENDRLVPQRWTMMANETRSITLMINNFTGTNQDYRISFSDFIRQDTNETVSGEKISKLYHMPHLKGLHEPDKLFTDLLTDAGKFAMLTVPAGCTRMITASISSELLMPGKWQGKLHITDLSDSRRSRDLPVTLEILPAALPAKSPMTIGPFGQKRVIKLINQNLGNNLNIIDIASFEGRMDKNGNLYPVDYTALRHAVRQALSVDKDCKFMILFASGVRFYRNAEKVKLKWPDERIKKSWQQWCRQTFDEFVKLGVPGENVYLQIADEPGGGTAAILTELQKLAKEAVPQIQLTTTLTGFDLKTPGNKEFFESLDHVVLTTKALRQQPQALDFFRQRNIKVANYDCWSVMETIDPTAYCRRPMIYCWANQLSGCFYWFRDDRKDNYSSVNSMSVIYPRRIGDVMRTAGPLLDGEEFDISRRYLAYQAGLADIKLLAMLDGLIKKYPNHAKVPEVKKFISEFCRTAETFYRPAEFPRHAPGGPAPELLNELHEKGALLANELLADDKFALKNADIKDGKLKLQFNEPCTLTVNWRVNGGMELKSVDIDNAASNFELQLAPEKDEVNYCRIKAVSGNGKVLECSPFVIGKITADSSFNGYSITAMTDGIRLPGAGYFSMLTWISSAVNNQHWVKLDWKKPQTISQVKLFWMTRNGLPTARKIETLQNGVWRETIPESPAESGVETLKFTPVKASALRVLIPAGKGSRYLPSMTGLSEIEVR